MEGLSKTFRIPHEKTTTLKGAALGLFNKKKYSEFKALKNINFKVRKGEFFGIIGRNGSGKSTLLKLLAGIYVSDRGAGKITINGKLSPFLELGVGFNPELTGRENLFLGGSILGMSKNQIEEKFDSIVAFSELREFIDMKLKNYSSGMQVRLAFSLAINAHAEILLMDEVLAVGDTNFQSKCLSEFNKYKEQGKTVVLVTHDIATAQRYCDRVMLLRSGRIIKIGKAEIVGNEYIRQNMSDEEERIEKEEIEEVGTAKKDKNTFEITGVKFLDKKENEKNIFENSDNIVARIYYNATKRILKPVFGVAIHTHDDTLVFGPNTKTSKFFIDYIEGQGYIDFEIVNNQLFTGKYKLTVALYNWECITPFAFEDRKYSFSIISKEENQYGIIKLDHVWKK